MTRSPANVLRKEQQTELFIRNGLEKRIQHVSTMLVYKSRFTRYDLSGQQHWSANRTNSLTPDLQPLREMKICMPDYI